jgi:5'-nucleotidase
VGPIVDIVNNTSDEVDLFITGHTHRAYNCLIDGRVVTSAGSNGQVLTAVDLVLNPETHDVDSVVARNIVVRRDVARRDVEAFVQRYLDASAPLAARPIGRISADILAPVRNPLTGTGQGALGALIADAQLAATQSAETGESVIAFMNPGGIRASLTFAQSGGEGDGVVTYGEAFTVQPFGNSLVVKTLTGAQIHDLLDQQFTGRAALPIILQVSEGFTYDIVVTNNFPTAVVHSSVRLNGVLVPDDNTPYRVTMNSFLATGGDGFTIFNEGTDPLGGDLDLDAFAAYLAPTLAGEPFVPPALDRVRAVAAP